MVNQQLSISVDGADAKLTTYFIDNLSEVFPNRTRPCVVVLPGGGYCALSDREGEPIALAMVAQGFHACVLEYSVAPATWPTAMLQVMKTVAWLRAHAEEYHIDVDRIVVSGFSAGGHLAASAAAYWQEDFVVERLGGEREDYRVNGAILGYPVITAGPYAHRGSIDNITGGDEALVPKMSIENAVTEYMPPVFLWHTVEDQLVPVENSLLMAEALRRAGKVFELHIFPYGEHGIALADEETADPADPKHPTWIQPGPQRWVELAAIWIRGL